MNVPERIAKLRSLMEEKGIDIYVVPTADFHQSEYVGEHFKARKFITGFSGSAGTAIITKQALIFGQTEDISSRPQNSWKAPLLS